MNSPPLIKADVPVVVLVDVLEKGAESPHRDGEASPLESRLKLVLVEPSVIVMINSLEQEEELLFRGLNEDPKLCSTRGVS